MQRTFSRMLSRYQCLLASNVPMQCRQVAPLATISTCTPPSRAKLPAQNRGCKQSYSQVLPRLYAAAVDASAIDIDTQAAGYAAFALDSRMTWPSRTHAAGTLTAADAGKDVVVCGWVDRNRNLGGLGFMDVRDHTGLLQVRMYSTTQQRLLQQFGEAGG